MITIPILGFFFLYWLILWANTVEKDLTIYQHKKFHIGFIWAWYDLWAGAYVTPKGRIFIMLPTIGITITVYKKLKNKQAQAII